MKSESSSSRLREGDYLLVDIDDRLTYERDEDDTLVLRVVGKHDKALKKP